MAWVAPLKVLALDPLDLPAAFPPLQFLVSRARCSAISTFTRVLDALWMRPELEPQQHPAVIDHGSAAHRRSRAKRDPDHAALRPGNEDSRPFAFRHAAKSFGVCSSVDG